jgi:hypothetical protein
MTVLEIVKDWLKEHGYDGLYLPIGDGEACGCSLDDFAPCGEIDGDCQAAYKWKDGLMHLEKEER